MKNLRFPTAEAARAALPSSRYEVIHYHDRRLDQWLYMVRRKLRPKSKRRRQPSKGPKRVAYKCEFHPDQPCQFPHKCQINLGCTHERGRHRTERLPWQSKPAKPAKPETTVRPVGYTVQYAYAGFEYQLTRTAGRWFAEPLPGQHHAAAKDKHRRAAVESYLTDYPADR